MTKPPLVADTGGLLRALARRPDGKASWPSYEAALRSARLVVVPTLVLAEVDYFLRDDRSAMRRLIEDILDPESTYALEPLTEADLARAMDLDAKFRELQLGLVDAVVASVAERRRIRRVLTTDIADFSPLRVGARYSERLEIVPG